MSRQEHAFALNNGQYRFLIDKEDDVIRVFIEGENGNECYLPLTIDEFRQMADNFISLSDLLQDTQS